MQILKFMKQKTPVLLQFWILQRPLTDTDTDTENLKATGNASLPPCMHTSY